MRNTLWSALLSATLIVLAIAAPLAAQVRFQQAFGGAELDYGFAVVQTDDGGYLVAGETQSFGAGFDDVWLIRTDSLGDTLWTRTYGSANYDAAFALAPASNGDHWVAGAAARSNGYADVWLARIDASGETLWTRTWGGQYNDYGLSVAATDDGGCIIAGETQSFGAGFSDGWLLKVNASGDTSWTRTYGTANYDFLYSVRAVPAGGYILAGSTRLPSGAEDAWLLRTDGDGVESWSRVFATTGFEELRTAVPTPDGGFAAAGTAPGASRNHFWLVKTDAAGDTLWTRVYERWPTTGEVGYSMAPTSDGGYVMTGSSQAEDVWVVRTDAAGDTLWTRLIGGGQPDAGRSVIQTTDGGYAITGYTRSYGAGWLDVWLVKTDPSGSPAIAEPGPRHAVRPPTATIARGVLYLRPAISNRQSEITLLDASGRAVMALAPGENDVRSLAPGIYFVVNPSRDWTSDGPVCKVILTR